MCENHRRPRVAVNWLRLVVHATARLAAQVKQIQGKELRLFLFLLKLYRFIFS